MTGVVGDRRVREREHPHTYFHGHLPLPRARTAVMRGDGDRLFHGLARIIRPGLGRRDVIDASYLRQHRINWLLNHAGTLVGHISVREWIRSERNVELDEYIGLLAEGEWGGIFEPILISYYPRSQLGLADPIGDTSQ